MTNDIFQDPIYRDNILTNLDLFINLDKLELSKLFLKIYIRKYLHILNKIQYRSKLINKLSKPDEAAKEHLKQRLESSQAWHIHNIEINKPNNAIGVFLMNSLARKQCDNKENPPAYCTAMYHNIMKAALENNIGAKDIHYMLSLVSLLYSKDPNNVEVKNAYDKVKGYKEQMINSEPINIKEFLETSAKITELFAKNFGKST